MKTPLKEILRAHNISEREFAEMMGYKSLHVWRTTNQNRLAERIENFYAAINPTTIYPAIDQKWDALLAELKALQDKAQDIPIVDVSANVQDQLIILAKIDTLRWVIGLNQQKP